MQGEAKLTNVNKEFRKGTRGLSYVVSVPESPLPRITLVELIFYVFRWKSQTTVFVRIANSSRVQLGKAVVAFWLTGSPPRAKQLFLSRAGHFTTRQVTRNSQILGSKPKFILN